VWSGVEWGGRAAGRWGNGLGWWDAGSGTVRARGTAAAFMEARCREGNGPPAHGMRRGEVGMNLNRGWFSGLFCRVIICSHYYVLSGLINPFSVSTYNLSWVARLQQ
jgi:hypothetical protein